ncbi:MAG TPA: Hsp70 family protein, partial [Candidatus Gemmiger faecavium]|nr:Hsp70 family protein [Candidatus Gemmiger faecavium]
IINEPTAAALAYGLDNGRTQKVMVYDLGGGTFDVSLIQIGDGVVQVLATCGDNHLGGDDFDERVVCWLVEQFRTAHGVDLSCDTVAMQRIREEAEKAKKELSSATVTEINLPFITTGPQGPLHLQETLTRAKFDELTADLVERTAMPVKNALCDAGLAANDLDQVLLVGGSTRIPAVQAKVMRMIDLEPSKTLNPDECVALGAAVQAGRLGGEMLSGGQDLLLLDVTPLTLSIETVGGVATHLIERNSAIPTRFSKIFTTAAPFQSTVEIKVLQGEREFARDNKLLGNFTLRGIKRAWAGVPQIEVTFDIDANGIVKVSARDLDTGKEQSITISGSSNLSEEEIRRAMHDAAMYAGQDKARKSAIEALNAGESAVYRVNSALGSKAGKALDRDAKNRIKDAERQLERAMKHKKPEKMTPDDTAQINAARESLEAVAAELLSVWEAQQSAQPQK